MKEYGVTARVEALRAAYMDSEMARCKLSYSRARRMKLLYRRGWNAHPEIENPILRRAFADAYLLDHMTPVIVDGELIVGQPDFSPLTSEEAAEANLPCDMPGAPGRHDHMALDFEKLLRLGVNGLIAEIEAKNEPDNVFYAGALEELHALLRLAERYAKAARARGMGDAADILARVPANPAQTFREALQSIHFYSFALWGLYQAGRPDRYLYPYYRRDIDAGILTAAGAQELVDCFCLMYTTYITSSSSVGFMIGGVDPDGNPVENELTWHFLYSIGHTRTADPSIGLCVNEHTSPELLDAAARLIAAGYTHPAFYGDTLIIHSLIDHGYAPADARDYIHSCCVEITAAGKSSIWTVSPYHNMVCMLLDVMRTSEADNFEAFYADYEEKLRACIIAGNEQENRWQAVRAVNGGEPLRVSVLVDDCIARGKSINEGGARYNDIQPNFLGLFNTADALTAIRLLVFEEKRLTMTEFCRILDADWEGFEPLRREAAEALPHYGNDDAMPDAMAKRLTESVAAICRTLTTYRGAKVVPALFSYNEHIRHGAQTPASPEGRHAGDPLCDGTNPVQGRDVKGPTAMLASTLSWDHAPFLGGIACNLELTRDMAMPEFIAALVKSYTGRGMELQINVVNEETLLDAKAHPERHRNLVVRVGGYSDYFVTLSEKLQDEIISRTRG